jgi:hypothetical protein
MICYDYIVNLIISLVGEPGCPSSALFNILKYQHTHHFKINHKKEANIFVFLTFSVDTGDNWSPYFA